MAVGAKNVTRLHPVPPAAHDWTTDRGYDPANFYTRANKQTAHVSLRVSENTHSEIAALVQSGRFPYRTMTEFFRDAVIHRLAWLKERTTDAKVRAITERAVAAATQDHARAQWREGKERYEDTVRFMSEIHAAVSTGQMSRGEMDHLLFELRQTARDLASPWNMYILGVLGGTDGDD